MDTYKMFVEKAWWQLYKNAASCIEQVLESTPHKTATLRPPTPIMKTIKVRRTRHAGHYWRSKGEFVGDILPWTPSHGRAKAAGPARNYIQELCVDTGCSLEDLPVRWTIETGAREGQRDPSWQCVMMMIVLNICFNVNNSIISVESVI